MEGIAKLLSLAARHQHSLHFNCDEPVLNGAWDLQFHQLLLVDVEVPPPPPVSNERVVWRTLFFEDFIVRWTRGDVGDMPIHLFSLNQP